MHNLLTDPLIRARIGSTIRALTLPELYAAMAADGIEAFPALRPHQRHAWHMFLAQLGAIALHRAGRSDFPQDAETWVELLRELTPGLGDDPWSLVVEDTTRSAFLQPPAPEGGLAAFKNTVATPDALDVLITAKNFDLKSAIAADASPEDWLFALISLQTMTPYGGNKVLPQCVRLGSGTSNRPFFAAYPADMDEGKRICFDTERLCSARGDVIGLCDFFKDAGGIALTWVEPWPLSASIRVDQLDPFFIEAPRRVRLIAPSGPVVALTAGDETPRIDGKKLKGLFGDFWSPVDLTADPPKMLAPTQRTFTATGLSKVLFSGKAAKLPSSLDIGRYHVGDRLILLIRAIAFRPGKSITEGFHERVIPFSGPPLRALFSPEGRDNLGAIAEQQLKEVKQVSDALARACRFVATGGGRTEFDPKTRQRVKPMIDTYCMRLEAVAEAGFFAALQDRFTGGDSAKAPFLSSLVRTARALLAEAGEAIPCASLNRPRARVLAERAFHSTLWGPKSVLVNDRSLILEKTNAA